MDDERRTAIIARYQAVRAILGVFEIYLGIQKYRISNSDSAVSNGLSLLSTTIASIDAILEGTQPLEGTENLDSATKCASVWINALD
jgi:hypothetical protein